MSSYESTKTTIESISELFEKGLINEDEYLDSINFLADTEAEEDYIDEFKYIYKVVMDKKIKLYYVNPEDTHTFLEMKNVKVYYIKVPTSSSEYQSAFYNTKSNRRITIQKEQPNEQPKYYLRSNCKSVDI